jgi:hypothetical protein
VGSLPGQGEECPLQTTQSSHIPRMTLRALIYQTFCRIFRQEIIRDGFRGILGREPEEEALKAYKESFKELGVGGLIIDLIQSPEAWEKQKLAHVEELMMSVGEGFFGGRVEKNQIKAQMDQFSRPNNYNIELSLRDLMQSQHGWERLLLDHSEKIVEEIYKGVLNRLPDQTGRKVYTKTIEDRKSIDFVIQVFMNSEEFLAKIKKTNLLVENYQKDEKKFVFIHIQKTAGTSLQNMLVDAYETNRVYHEHEDTISSKKFDEILQFKVFAGHFNYDSLEKFPFKDRHLITILRDPSERIISLYNFWRAHESNAKGYHNGMEIARKHTLAEFLRETYIKDSSHVWNHITWCIMGRKKWSEWKILMGETPFQQRQIILNQFQNEIKLRLKDFIFIGFQDKFEESVKNIFELLGKPQPAIRHDHSLEQLSKRISSIKLINKIIPNKEEIYEIKKMTQLDNIVYSESKKIYNIDK